MFDLDTLTKKPSESRVFTMNFASLLDAGETISGVVNGYPLVTPADGTLSISSVTPSGATVAARYAGGADLSNPKITIKVTTTLGNTLTGTGYLKLKEF